MRRDRICTVADMSGGEVIRCHGIGGPIAQGTQPGVEPVGIGGGGEAL